MKNANIRLSKIGKRIENGAVYAQCPVCKAGWLAEIQYDSFNKDHLWALLLFCEHLSHVEAEGKFIVKAVRQTD